MRNTRTSNPNVPREFTFRQCEWPFTKVTVMKKLYRGMTRGQIIASAHANVAKKAKNWKQVKQRLGCMTSSTQAPGTGFPPPEK
jgi:hypothetical protein